MAHRIINSIIAVMFFMAAWVQYNDTDPWGWIALYGAMGLISVFAAFNRYNALAIVAVAGIALLWGAYLFPGVLEWLQHHAFLDLTNRMSDAQPYIEEAREALGLLLGVLIMGYHFVCARRNAEGMDVIHTG